MRVVFSATATREFTVAVEWWRENRPQAPTLLEDEMADVVKRLGEAPMSGQPVHHPRTKGLRRASLEGTRYHLYYRVHEKRGVVWVLRLYHMSRMPPQLPRR